MSNSLFSVCIPTFNRSELALRAVHSALAQRNANIEIIIQDNCSDDGSYDILRSALPTDERIRLYRTERNLGWVGNINSLVRRSNGEFVGLLCDDDCYEATYVAECVQHFRAHQNVGMVHTGHWYLDRNGARVNELGKYCGRLERGWDAVSTLVRNFDVNFSSVAVRREIYERVGAFEESISSDYEMWPRIARFVDVGYIDQPLVRFDVHRISEQMTVSRYVSESEKVSMLVKQHLLAVGWDSQDADKVLADNIARGCVYLGRQCSKVGRWRDSISFQMEAYRLSGGIEGFRLALELGKIGARTFLREKAESKAYVTHV